MIETRNKTHRSMTFCLSCSFAVDLSRYYIFSSLRSMSSMDYPPLFHVPSYELQILFRGRLCQPNFFFLESQHTITSKEQCQLNPRINPEKYKEIPPQRPSPAELHSGHGYVNQLIAPFKRLALVWFQEIGWGKKRKPVASRHFVIVLLGLGPHIIGVQMGGSTKH